jgi:hypothetical protein
MTEVNFLVKKGLTVPKGSASTPSVIFGASDPNTGLYSPGADQVAVATNGSGRLFINASGSISTSSTAWQGGPVYELGGLQLGASTYAKALLQTGGTSRAEWFFDSADNYIQAKSGGFYISNTTANPITFGTNATERLRITSAGLVGIGTSSPSAPLHVARSGGGVGLQVQNTSTYSQIEITSGGTDSNAYFTFSPTGTGKGIIQLGGSDKIAIDSSGRVGIGTTSPGVATEISSSSAGNVADTLRLNNPNSNAGSGSRISFYTPAAVFSAIDGVRDSGGSGGSIRFNTMNTAGSLGERGRWDTEGRLLVGTSTSTSATVNGLVGKTQIASSENAALALHGHSSTALYGADIVFTRSRSATIGTNTIVQNGDEFGRIYFTGANGTGFDYGASIQAVVDGTPGVGDMPGRLVFSTTASGASSPTERTRITSGGRLLQFSSGGDAFVGVTGSGAGLVNTLLALNHSGTSTTTGTNCFYVATNGDVRNTNNSYGAISDIKLKENIVDANSQWDDIKSLQVRKYNFKPETNQQTHTQIGLVAQEVELVSPGLVSESPDLDEDGNDLGTVTKSVNYSVLYMKAVKALQEAMERIETLEAKVAALETP